MYLEQPHFINIFQNIKKFLQHYRSYFKSFAPPIPSPQKSQQMDLKPEKLYSPCYNQSKDYLLHFCLLLLPHPKESRRTEGYITLHLRVLHGDEQIKWKICVIFSNKKYFPRNEITKEKIEFFLSCQNTCYSVHIQYKFVLPRRLKM